MSFILSVSTMFLVSIFSNVLHSLGILSWGPLIIVSMRRRTSAITRNRAITIAIILPLHRITKS
jgi:hypothetical protein